MRFLCSGARSAGAVALALSLGVAVSPRTASASPEDIFGYGARSSGMAGTGSASAEGFESVYANPALLAYARQTKLTLGTEGAWFHLQANGTLPTDSMVGSIIGATLPVPLPGVMKNKLVLGLGFFTPFDLVVRGKILYPERSQFLLPARAQSVAIQAGLGLDLCFWRGCENGGLVHLGGGFAALAALRGNVLVSEDSTGKIGSVVQDTLVASFAPILGVSVQIAKDYRVGATFRGELVGRFNVQINVQDLGSITVPPLNIAGVAQFDPLQVQAEFARVIGRWKGAVSLTYKHWSAYPGAPEGTVQCSTDENGKTIPCDALVPPAPDFHDTVVPRISVEYTATPRSGVDMRFRAGYAFEPTPAPEQTSDPNVFDEHRSIFALGYGLDLEKPVLAGFSVDFFAQLQVLHGRDHVKDASVAHDNPGYPDVQTSGVVLAGGTQVGVAF